MSTIPDLTDALAKFAERRKARIDCEYAELRDLDIDLFRECVQTADCIVANHLYGKLDNADQIKLAFDIESSMISMALRILTDKVNE